MKEKNMVRGAGLMLGLAMLAAGPAMAALQPGAAAPDFSAAATQGGNEFSFKLSDALKKGPVVLYFYPAAFTKGCTEEAHEFADATAQFHDLGASVFGVSQDGIEKLKKFSVSECRSKFPVLSDKDGTISKEYDAELVAPLGYSNRTSYVILPDGHVSYEYTAMDPTGHVGNTLAAVKKWKAGH
jgi:thioredoxin-dependent peroxiredoxin